MIAAPVEAPAARRQARIRAPHIRWLDIDERVQPWIVAGRFRKGWRTHVVPLRPLAMRMLAGVRSITGDADRSTTLPLAAVPRWQPWGSAPHSCQPGCRLEKSRQTTPPFRASPL